MHSEVKSNVGVDLNNPSFNFHLPADIINNTVCLERVSFGDNDQHVPSVNLNTVIAI